MCITPSHVWVQRGPKWEQQAVACRKCWRCKQNRVNDYVARCLAEAAFSQVTCTVTLTYAPRKDLADKILQPPHFQTFIRSLRRSGHKVRYLVAGEYGGLKDRAHFHAVLFFQDLLPLHGHDGKRLVELDKGHYVAPMVPRYKDDLPEWADQRFTPFCREIPQMRMVHIREWPHGHIKADWNADERSIRYVCKYLLSEDKANAWFSLSKKPPLGAEFFASKAERAKELGVLPSTFEYLPPGGDKAKPYLMTGASRRDYLGAIDPDPARRPHMSEWVGKTFDKYQREAAQAVADAIPPEQAMQAWLERRADDDERQRIGEALKRERLTWWADEMLYQGRKVVIRSGEYQEVPDDGSP